MPHDVFIPRLTYTEGELLHILDDILFPVDSALLRGAIKDRDVNIIKDIIDGIEVLDVS